MATAQTASLASLAFHYIKDRPNYHQALIKALTIDSLSQTTGITVTKDPDELWIVVPATVDHGVPFNVQFAPTVAAPNDIRRILARGMTLTFSKATYDDLVVPITVKSMPGGPPA
jgi:hypothetical protein